MAGEATETAGEDRERAIARNQSVHRRLNEAIERGRWPGEQRPSAFRCECARRGCTEMLELTIAEYERLRSHPRRFALAVGHDNPAVEEVVDSHAPRYVVVEKRGQAGRVAEAADPRS